MDAFGGLKTVDDKLTLIMDSNGIQIAMLVDEVIKVRGGTNVNKIMLDTNIATFKIFQFKRQMKSL